MGRPLHSAILDGVGRHPQYAGAGWAGCSNGYSFSNGAAAFSKGWPAIKSSRLPINEMDIRRDGSAFKGNRSLMTGITYPRFNQNEHPRAGHGWLQHYMESKKNQHWGCTLGIGPCMPLARYMFHLPRSKTNRPLRLCLQNTRKKSPFGPAYRSGGPHYLRLSHDPNRTDDPRQSFQNRRQGLLWIKTQNKAITGASSEGLHSPQ